MNPLSRFTIDFEPNSNTQSHIFPQVGIAHITLAHMLLLLQGIVSDFGADYNPNNNDDTSHGAGCVYAQVRNGVLSPVCIVGQVFHRIGLLGLLANVSVESNHGACQNGDFFDALDSVVTFDPLAIVLMQVAQERQDGGTGWGQAVMDEVEVTKRTYQERDTTLAMLDGFSL